MLIFLPNTLYGQGKEGMNYVVYLCMCIYVCMYEYVCIYVCMYACMYVCMYECMYVRMYVYMCYFCKTQQAKYIEANSWNNK